MLLPRRNSELLAAGEVYHLLAARADRAMGAEGVAIRLVLVVFLPVLDAALDLALNDGFGFGFGFGFLIVLIIVIVGNALGTFGAFLCALDTL